MNASSRLWLIPAALILAAGIASFVAQVFFLPGDVDAEDWRQPARYVLDHIGPADAVTVQPGWNEDAYPYLTEVGDQVIRQHHPLLEDVHRYERVWLLSESERLDEALELMPFEAAETHPFGSVTLVRLDAPEERVVHFDLLERLDEAEVSRVDGDKEIRQCDTWDADKRAWYCRKPHKWIYVGEELLFFGLDPHRCIWAHPPGKGRKVRLRFDDVPMGETFRVRAGLNQRAARSKRGTDVHVRVIVDEDLVEERTIPARENSWKPIDVDTSHIAGQEREVVVEIWSKKVYDRFFCLNGWSLDE